MHICDLFLGICEIPCHLCSVPNLLYYKYSEIVTGKLYNDILLQEDTKGVIRIRNSKKNRQRNGQEKKDKQRSTKHTHKIKDRVTRTPLKTKPGVNSDAPEWEAVHAPLVAPVVLLQYILQG